MGKPWKQWETLFLEAPKSLQMVTAAMKLKDTCSLEENLRQYIKKQRHYFAKKGTSGQYYGFSTSHIWTWELDYKERWAPNWCFWIVVLEKTLESPLDCKQIQPCGLVSRSIMRPHGLQHARLPCPSPTPRAYSNSCPSSQWCHPTISSTVLPFSFCLQRPL